MVGPEQALRLNHVPLTDEVVAFTKVGNLRFLLPHGGHGQAHFRGRHYEGGLRPFVRERALSGNARHLDRATDAHAFRPDTTCRQPAASVPPPVISNVVSTRGG